MSRIVAPVAIMAVLLTACSTEEEPPPQPTPSGTPVEEPTAPSSSGESDDDRAQAVSVTAPFGKADVEYEVGPLIDLGEASLLRVKLKNNSGESDPDARVSMSYFGALVTNSFTTGRLVDVESGTVELAGLAGEKAVGTGASDMRNLNPGEDLEVFTAFGPQDSDTVDVVLPYLGAVFDVPVVGVEETGGQFQEAIDKLVPAPGSIEAQVFDLESYSLGLTGEVDRVRTDDAMHVSVAADVLFAVDKASLSKSADAALKQAARQIDRTGAGSGELLVIGHTDDVGTRAHNQKLSERRAESVAKRMAKLADLGDYSIKTVGKAFDEPRAEGTSEAARAKNRRVELIFKPGPTTTTEKEQVDLPIPESKGPTAAGAQGVEITLNETSKVNVKMDRVVRRGPYLFGELEVAGTAESAPGSSPGLFLATKPGTDVRGNYNVKQIASPVLLALLADEQWNYPLDYKPSGSYVTVTQPTFNAPVEQDMTYRLPVVWPDVSGGAPTVTMDVAMPPDYKLAEAVEDRHVPFRLTDIEVVDG